MKKLFIILLLLLGSVSTLTASITVVQGASPTQTTAASSTPTMTITYTGAVAAGNTLVIFASSGNTSLETSVTDNVNGGSWSQAAAPPASPSHNPYIWYKTNTLAGTPTITVNFSPNCVGCEMIIFEISGASTPQFDKSSSTHGTTGVTDPGNLNTTMANSFILAGTENTATESTGGATYTFLDVPNGFDFAGSQFKIVSATSNYSTAFATNTANTWDAVAANFGESGGAAVVCKRSLLGVGC